MNWEKGKEVRSMQDGEEKDDLLHFCCHHKVGNKYVLPQVESNATIKSVE